MDKFLSFFKDSPEDFIFSDYEWNYKEQIGEGGFGKVFKVRDKSNNCFVAIKQLNMKLFDEDFKLQALKSEIKIMKDIKNPNIVQMIDQHMGKDYAYIILQLCDSDLKKELQTNKGTLPEAKCAEIFHQIANGFKKMVKKQYMHRDVKPDNILIKGQVYKVADFGFSKKIDMKNKEKIDEVCGTPLYMAPQLLFNQKYSEKCDIWSLGLMLYEMIFGFDPWPTKHPEVYKENLLTKPIAFPYDAKIGQNTYDLLRSCLQVDEAKRISWQQFFKHPFVEKRELGALVQFPKVQQKFIRVLQSVQECVRRKNVNLLESFREYSKKMGGQSQELDKKQFFIFLKQMDNTITTYQSENLFRLADYTKDGKVSLEEFYDLFCNLDYRSSEDIASRRVQEIISLAQARNIQMRQFFEMFDTDESNTIDLKEFETMIKKIAPQISAQEIRQMWERFDSDNSGEIDCDEFIAQMTRNAPNQGSQVGGYRYQRSRRNIINFGQFLESQKIGVRDFFKQTDKNKDQKLTIDEFGPMIQKFNYEISKEEVEEMFKVFDSNNNQAIEMEELEKRFRFIINS